MRLDPNVNGDAAGMVLSTNGNGTPGAQLDPNVNGDAAGMVLPPNDNEFVVGVNPNVNDDVAGMVLAAAFILDVSELGTLLAM